jgi:uncharacterized protein YbjQ (UPF0145 family)
MVDEATPVWAVTYQDKPALLAIVPSGIVVAIATAMGANEYLLALKDLRHVETDGPAISFINDTRQRYVFALGSAEDSETLADSTTRRIAAGPGSRIDAPPVPALATVSLATTESVPGHETVAFHGDVVGVVVRARNMFSNLGASLRTVVGGEVAGYTSLLTEARNQARERLAESARAKGANAVVGMRFDSSEIGDLMSEIVAYGTAVTIRPLTRPGATGAPSHTP